MTKFISLMGLALIAGQAGAADTPASLMAHYAAQAGVAVQAHRTPRTRGQSGTLYRCRQGRKMVSAQLHGCAEARVQRAGKGRLHRLAESNPIRSES